MSTTPAMLALVTGAFGGRGGIAQYNRDFLGALAGAGVYHCAASPRARFGGVAPIHPANTGAAWAGCLFGRGAANRAIPVG